MKIKFLTERPFGEKVKKWLISQGEVMVENGQDITISCYSRKILTKKEIEEAPMGTINFHTGLLPFNRGMHANLWPLIDGTPAGVTLHWMTREVDCGPIIAQTKVKVEPTDIASDMDRKTQKAMFDLFTKWWPKIKIGKAPRIEQRGPSTRHYEKDIHVLDKFDKRIIGRLRACTYDDKSFGYFIDKGKKIYVGVKFYEKK